MKKAALLYFFAIISNCCCSQLYYFRGLVTDAAGTPLQNTVIYQPRTHQYHTSSFDGSFGITTTSITDSLVFSLPGFQEVSIWVHAEKYANIVLRQKRNSGLTSKITSFTLGMPKPQFFSEVAAGETYAVVQENIFAATNLYPRTDIALNIDKASYSNIRRFINTRSVIPPDAVRIEEMLNYFDFSGNAVPDSATFSLTSRLSNCPWNKENYLLFLHLNAKNYLYNELPPCNLVFLIDVSASMELPNRLSLIKSAFGLLLKNLRSVDSVAIVTYGATTKLALPLTSGSNKKAISDTLERITAGGFTAGESGIKMAYRIAQEHYNPKGVNRVILATDGDFNVGIKTENELENFIAGYKNMGIYLTCLGVGMGNYKDSKIQTLSRQGHGNFAYIDNYAEAEKVLMNEFAQTMFAVAGNAYMQVHFNELPVTAYKLIGFENKLNSLSDSVAKIQGGEIGSGYCMMGIFEVKTNEALLKMNDTIGAATLCYKKPADTTLFYESFVLPNNFRELDSLPAQYGLAVAVAQFGRYLKSVKPLPLSAWNPLIAFTHSKIMQGNIIQDELLELMKKAARWYGADSRENILLPENQPRKKRKKNRLF